MKKLVNISRLKEKWRRLSRTKADGDFFEAFSTVKDNFEDRSAKIIEEFNAPETVPDVPDGPIGEQLWPTLQGWNLDKLYCEILHDLIPAISAQDKNESESMVAYIQQVFRIEDKKNIKLLNEAREKQAAELVLNLEVVEAKDLKAKDVNGLSDPFCVMYLSPDHKHSTSVKSATLNPTWREYFSFPISSCEDEVLSIDLWDHDPEESVTGKMKRLNEVKSAKGLRNLIKEMTATASPSKQSNDFLGCLKIPIKTIPGDGLDQWFYLDSKTGSSIREGEIHMRLTVGTNKDKNVIVQEYEQVLYLVLTHELDNEEIGKHAWSGQFSKEADYILDQLAWRGGLLPADVDMAKCLVYSRVHCEHPLNAEVFPPIFSAVLELNKDGRMSDEEIQRFWITSESVLDNFCCFLERIHLFHLTTTAKATQVCSMIKTLGLLTRSLAAHSKTSQNLEIGLTVDLIAEKVKNALIREAEDFFNDVLESVTGQAKGEVERMTDFGQVLIEELRSGFELLDPVYKEELGIYYFEATYRIYDKKYCNLAEPAIHKACETLKVKQNGMAKDGLSHDPYISNGSSLFGLYLAMKQFADLSENFESKNDLSIKAHFHSWFYPSVAYWLDMACIKADQRIEKAVQLDKLIPDSYVGYEDKRGAITTSAIDTLLVFYQIKDFWSQLSWPAAEDSYAFTLKIIDNLCNGVIMYANKVKRKADEFDNKDNGTYYIADELCFAINNIYHIAHGMADVIASLETERVLNELEEKDGKERAEQSKKMVEAVMENAKLKIMHRTKNIMNSIGLQMEPFIQRLLAESVAQQNEESIDKLCRYLNEILSQLDEKVTPDGFKRIHSIMWETASKKLKDITRTNVEKLQPPPVFLRIQKVLQILSSVFYPEDFTEDVSYKNSDVREVEDLVSFHGATTADLILKYTQERMRLQNKIHLREAKDGSITIRAAYCEGREELIVEVLNCRSLKAHDRNGSSDPFVKLDIVSKIPFPTLPLKTKVQKETLFPLFDEKFYIPIKATEMKSGGILQFVIKDHDIVGRNDYMGDAYLSLESAPFITRDSKLEDLPQVCLPLTIPGVELSLLLQTIEIRTWDQDGAKFAKKERNKFCKSTHENLSP